MRNLIPKSVTILIFEKFLEILKTQVVEVIMS